MCVRRFFSPYQQVSGQLGISTFDGVWRSAWWLFHCLTDFAVKLSLSRASVSTKNGISRWSTQVLKRFAGVARKSATCTRDAQHLQPFQSSHIEELRREDIKVPTMSVSLQFLVRSVGARQLASCLTSPVMPDSTIGGSHDYLNLVIVRVQRRCHN